MDDQKKMTHPFSHFFENFSGSNGLNRSGMRVVIHRFKIHTINSVTKNNNFETISACPELYYE